MEEIIDVFRPSRYVHIGHDEVYRIGVCPVCRRRDPAELFVEDVRRIYDYLQKKGLGVMMWADMLQPVTRYKTPQARFVLPRDIVMLDFIWYFHLDKDIEENLLDAGYSVVMGNLYSSHFPRYASRVRQAGMLGGEVSSWVETEEDALSREGKLYDMLYTAQMLWSAEYTPYLRYTYDRMLSALLPQLRDALRGVPAPSHCRHTETLLWADGEEQVAGGKFAGLVFAHATKQPRHREPWKPFAVIGKYTVTYVDGKTIDIDLRYGGNIGEIGRRQHLPLLHPFYRHNGYLTAWETDAIEERTPSGALHTFYRYEWVNPRPKVAIAALRYDGAADVIIRHIIGITPKV